MLWHSAIFCGQQAAVQNQQEQEEMAKKMEVCETCGALLVSNDAQQRIDEHIMGKQHMGYARIRACVEGRKVYWFDYISPPLPLPPSATGSDLCCVFSPPRMQAAARGQAEQEELAKKMEVCDVCGSLLVANDTQQRVDEHLMGKQHMGYARIRAAIEGRKVRCRGHSVRDRIISVIQLTLPPFPSILWQKV